MRSPVSTMPIRTLVSASLRPVLPVPLVLYHFAQPLPIGINGCSGFAPHAKDTRLLIVDGEINRRLGLNGRAFRRPCGDVQEKLVPLPCMPYRMFGGPIKPDYLTDRLGANVEPTVLQ